MSETTPMGGHDDHNPFLNRHTYVRQHVDQFHTSTMVFGGRERVVVPKREHGSHVLSLAYSSFTGRVGGVTAPHARDEQIDAVAIGGLELTKTLSKMLEQVMACRWCRGTGVVVPVEHHDEPGQVCACRTRAQAMLHQLPGWYQQASRILSQ